MKIAMDARMIKMSGIGTYIQNLIKENDYEVLLGNKDDISKFSNQNIIEFDSKIYGIKEQLKFPYKKLKKEKIDILHVPHYNIPIFYRGRMITTIHDLTHLIYPEFLPNKFAYFYAKFMIWLALKKSQKVITDSENTKKDILERFKVNPEKIEVINCGVGKEFVKKSQEEISYLYERFNIPKNKKILMYVGNLKPHKNLERLLEAYSKIEKKDETVLVLVGKAFEKYNVLEDKEKSLNIEKNVIHTGIVTQDELVDLYNLADLFIFPSLYEGFGLPVLESLACGTPVICSNTSSIPEVGADKVVYFNPLDIDEIAREIDKNIYSKENFNTEEINEYLKKFSWDEVLKKTRKILDT